MNLLPDWLRLFLERELLPADFGKLAVDYYIPLANRIVEWAEDSGGSPLLVGVNGAQGTGKSTMCEVLQLALHHSHQLRCAVLSIDDIYLMKSEREALAEEVHPLLVTRGVPGTHDVAFGVGLLEAMKCGKSVSLPVFDKSIDDRAPESDWLIYDERVDVILFEGWCVGAEAQSEEDLVIPCNMLEETEDTSGEWRAFCNQKLAVEYRELFGLLDKLVMLKAPDFESVYEWRSVQEEKLRAKVLDEKCSKLMDDGQIKRFIMHYERLTRWMFEEMPGRVDCLLELDRDHHIVRNQYSDSSTTLQ